MKKGSSKKSKSSCSEKLMILMIVCVLLSLATLGIVAYDKLIKNDKSDCQVRTNADGLVWRDCNSK